MKSTRFFWFASLLLALLPACASKEAPQLESPGRQRSELDYLRAVNSAAPPKDPQLLFLLMAQYSNANLAGEGAAFFEARLAEFGPRLNGAQKALYLGAIGLLSVQNASNVALLRRTGWVNDSIAKLEEAKRLSGGEVFVLRWIAGVVYARLPSSFDRRAMALADLEWCRQNIAKAPHSGWLREVYYGLAELARQSGDAAKADALLRQSGYTSFDKPITLTTPFSEDAERGHSFAPARISQPVPGVHVLTGFEFTEYYFVVSRDRRELFAIDAGTRSDSAKDAYTALRATAPDLPPLTKIFITHSHWDHIGGHAFFRALEPAPRFYARANYAEELARSSNAPTERLPKFFGSRFSLDDVRRFKPDVLVEGPMDLEVGGTRVELIPVQGGETSDALLIYLPEAGVMFAGDILMPYFGAPFIEEGSVPGLFSAIDIVVQKDPKFLLHGHEPLTRLFPSPALLAELKPKLVWLEREVATRIRRGEAREQIQQANLIPPGLFEGNPDLALPYGVLRENLINRVYDQSIGYWHANLEGLDYLSEADRGALLTDYFGLSEADVLRAVERLIDDGKYELARTALAWTRGKFPTSLALSAAERHIYLKLMEKNQDTNPFKFILYAGKLNERVPELQPSPSN